VATYTLDFERPLLELEKQIEELNASPGRSRSSPGTSSRSKTNCDVAARDLPQPDADAARPGRPPSRRPYPLDYVNTVFTDFVELHGDRCSATIRRSSEAGPGWTGRASWSSATRRAATPRTTCTATSGCAPGRLPQGDASHAARRQVRRARHHARGYARRISGLGAEERARRKHR